MSGMWERCGTRRSWKILLLLLLLPGLPAARPAAAQPAPKQLAANEQAAAADANVAATSQPAEQPKAASSKKPDEAAAAKDDTPAEEEPNPFAEWLAGLFPERLHKTHFLLPSYQWLCLLVVICAGFVADQLTRLLLWRVSLSAAKYFGDGETLSAEPKLWRPVGLLVNATVWYVGTAAIGLPEFFSNILLVALKLFAVVAAVWTSFLLINLLTAFLAKKAARTATKLDDLLLPMVSKSLKVLVLCMGLLSAADALNLPIAGLVGGLGLGGLALAMASKDAVANLFGSITVAVDRPFEVGDWIVMSGAEGTVEKIGFRSTRIRTFYNSQITVPNSLLTTAIVDNMGRRRYRRIKTTLGVQYDTTPEQIDAFCEGVRELIRRHPYTRKDYFHVYFNDFGDSSLNILLYCFVEVADWSMELRERHRLLADILRLAAQLGVQFAFPTRTLHMFQEPPPGESPSVDDPWKTGQRLGAELAGPLPAPGQLPGPVVFGGPSPVN